MEAAPASPNLDPPCLQQIGSVEGTPFYCLCCRVPILLPGIDHLQCLQEIRSVKDKPFCCQTSVGTITFQGPKFVQIVLLLLLPLLLPLLPLLLLLLLLLLAADSEQQQSAIV